MQPLAESTPVAAAGVGSGGSGGGGGGFGGFGETSETPPPPFTTTDDNTPLAWVATRRGRTVCQRDAFFLARST